MHLRGGAEGAPPCVISRPEPEKEKNKAMKKPFRRRKRGARVVLRSSVVLTLGLLLLAGGRMLNRGALLLPERQPDAQAWNLVLVNGSHFLPEDFSVELTEVENGQSVDARIADSLRAMLADARSAGLDPVVRSGYRSQSTQTYLYNRKIRQYTDKGYAEAEAAAAAARWVAPPGTSEHQLGLAVDLVGRSHPVLDKRQENTPEQQWLMEHCWEYGFVLRYPSDKSDITGIAYEPWHYRYVGREAAGEMTERGLCLEEYLESLTEP